MVGVWGRVGGVKKSVIFCGRHKWMTHIVFVTDKTSIHGASLTQHKHTFINIPGGPPPNLMQMSSPLQCNAMSKAK